MARLLPRSHRNLLVSLLVLGASVASAAGHLSAAVGLPAVISDNMVLQSGMSLPIWGWAERGEEVTVTVGDQTKKAIADQDGRWMVRLDPLTEGGPLAITVSGENTITINNVLVGEVWVCSGQSNMQWSVKNSNDPKKEITAAKYPKIRLFQVPTRGTQTPLYDCEGRWVECSPKQIGGFSAVGYFFGRELHQELKAPIGLIQTAWGGSVAVYECTHLRRTGNRCRTCKPYVKNGNRNRVVCFDTIMMISESKGGARF